MPADTILAKLDKVRRVGDGRWVALCPGHEDKNPSLSIRELDDGRILLHDFAGCAVESILAAVGLEFDALFPERPIEHARGMRRPFIPQDVFEIARREIAVVAVAAADMHKGRTISEADYERIFTAAERLDDIARAAYGR